VIAMASEEKELLINADEHRLKKMEIIEETIKKLDVGEGDLKNLERVRQNLWKKEKLKL